MLIFVSLVGFIVPRVLNSASTDLKAGFVDFMGVY